MTEIEAEELAARLTRIWTSAQLGIGGKSGPLWSFRFGIFDFDCPLADELRVEMKLHKDGGFLRLNHEITSKDEKRPWYEEPQITTIASLYVDMEGYIYTGAEETQHQEAHAQFAAEWLPLFRRNCYLSGIPIECSTHEKIEWMRDVTHEEIEAWESQPLANIKPDRDYHAEIDKQSERVLKKYNITLAEDDLMSTVGYKIYLPPEELAEHTRALSKGGRHGHFSPTEYLQALEPCIVKGWLQVTTAESRQSEGMRRRESSLPELLDEGAQIGEVEFTPQGYLTYRQTILEIFGQDHVAYNDSGWNHHEERREFEVLASNRKCLQKRVGELVDDMSPYRSEEGVIISVSDPEPLGQWKPNSFFTLNEGLRCIIVYRPT